MFKIRKKSAVLGIFLLSTLFMSVFANAAGQDENVLIVYYSQSGNTEEAADSDRADETPGLEEELTVKELYEEFTADPDGAAEKYRGTPVIAEGVVLRTGADIHGTPSVELSDTAGGERYATYVVSSFDQLEAITVGDTVTMKGNFHIVSSSEWGIVMKQGEVID